MALLLRSAVRLTLWTQSGGQMGAKADGEGNERYSSQARGSAFPPSCCHGDSPSRQSRSKAGFPSGQPAIPGSRGERGPRPPLRAGTGHPGRPIPAEGGDFPRKPGPTPLAPGRSPLSTRDPPPSVGSGGSVYPDDFCRFQMGDFREPRNCTSQSASSRNGSL